MAVNYRISLNQLAEFSGSTANQKRRIVESQRNPPAFIVPRYRTARVAIRKSLELKGSPSPVQRAIKILKEKKTETKWQATEKTLSIEALQEFLKTKVPSIFNEFEFSLIKPTNKTFSLRNVGVIVAPDLIIRGTYRKKVVLGALKIHISKTHKFDRTKSLYAAAIVYHYLVQLDEILGGTAVRELCFSLDVFDHRFVHAPDNSDELLNRVGFLCSEIKTIWDKLDN